MIHNVTTVLLFLLLVALLVCSEVSSEMRTTRAKRRATFVKGSKLFTSNTDQPAMHWTYKTPHDYLTKKIAPPECTTCNEDLSVKYIIQDRTLYNRQRQQFLIPSTENALDPVNCHTVRLNFKAQNFAYTNIFAYAAGYKLTFDLPDNATITGPSHFHRRALYESIESILEEHGLNGRSCILKFLCEVAQNTIPTDDFVKRIVKVIFTIPEKQYDSLFPYLSWSECSEVMESCPLSIFHILALQPAVGVY